MSTIAITGASSGIGLELTKLYLERGDKVIAICRATTDELKATKAEIIEDIDLLNDESYSKLQQALSDRDIDILINNAGILFNETITNMAFDQISTQFEINAFAPIKVTMALLSNLSTGSKVLMTTSRMGSINDNSSGGYYGYRASKAALNAFTKSLSIDLKAQGICVALVHPGFVKTKMTSYNGEITPTQSAQGYAKLADNLNMNNSGGFWHVNGEELPW